MKWYKKILTICSFCTLLSTVNCFAVTNIDTNFNKDQSICYKTYQIKQEEQKSFEENLEKTIQIDDTNYILKDYKFTGGNIETTKDINTTKTITLKTNNINAIIDELGETIEYNEDGYVGTYNLNIDTIKVKTNYNGFYEKLIEKTVEYKDLNKNDLDYIPKEINKNNKVLHLLKTDWKPQDYTNIGENEVPNKYIANCYYATKEKVNYPNTYTIDAEYYGVATKIEENPITYTVEYEKQFIEEPIKTEEKKNNILPVVGGTTGIILVIVFFLIGNVTVFNYRDGKWVKVGKIRIINNKIKLNRFSLFERTNRYKLELSESATNRLNGKLITIQKNDNSLKTLVNSNGNSKYIFEVRL